MTGGNDVVLSVNDEMKRIAQGFYDRLVDRLEQCNGHFERCLIVDWLDEKVLN